MQESFRRIENAVQKQEQVRFLGAGEEVKMRRAYLAYYLRVVEKCTETEIANIFKISRRTVQRYIAAFRRELNLSQQDRTDIVFFYEKEIQRLLEKRERTRNDRWYLAYTDRIMYLQEKIAKLLQFLQGGDVYVQNNFTQIFSHYTADELRGIVENLRKGVVAERPALAVGERASLDQDETERDSQVAFEQRAEGTLDVAS